MTEARGSGGEPRAMKSGTAPSLATKIFAGLVLGVATGLFFGELCAPLSVVADAFVGLLEMTVLPYIVVTLIANLARLDPKGGRSLIFWAVRVLLVLWGIGLFAVVMIPLSLPDFAQGSFFSSSWVDEGSSIDFLQMFIPNNVFFSLQANFVPAIVLFCVAVGIALISVENKQRLIDPLDAAAAALLRVNSYVVRLTPYGVFAIGASTAGTMTLESLGRLQAYLIEYTLFIGILSFGVLPLLITATTPFSYGQIMRGLKAPMLTAFVTGKVLVVLPMLIESTQDLFRGARSDSGNTDSDIEVLYPLAYPFPHLGKLAGLLFIPFSAWFIGDAMKLIDYPLFLIAGLFGYFGGPILATPFLLDLMELPRDMMQLFVASGVVTARMGDVLGVMHFVALATIATAASNGLFRIRWSRLFRGFALWGAIGLVSLMGVRVFLHATFQGQYSRSGTLSQMYLLEDPVDSILLEWDERKAPVASSDESLIEQIRNRGRLDACVIPNRVPFTFRNAAGEWVGYDVELAHRLARMLGVDLGLLPIDDGQLGDAIRDTRCDFVMGGQFETLSLAERAEISDPYLYVSVAVVMLDHRVDEIGGYKALASQQDLVLATDTTLVMDGIRRFFPNAKVQLLENAREFFEDETRSADALVTSAESGFAWTTQYPAFAVVNPLPRHIEVPLVFALNPRHAEFARYLDHFIGISGRDGTRERLYDHWIMGVSPDADQPRWSVIRNVLGWID